MLVSNASKNYLSDISTTVYVINITEEKPEQVLIVFASNPKQKSSILTYVCACKLIPTKSTGSMKCPCQDRRHMLIS